MKQKLIGLSNLTRWKDNVLYSLMNTLIGIYFASGWLGYRATAIFVANWFGIIFMYIINDIEDSEDDAKDEKKKLRNPISAGIFTKKQAYIILLGFGLVSLGLYLVIAYYIKDIMFALISLLTILVGYLYSAKPVRLKSRLGLDLLSHSFMLGFAQFVLTALSFPSYSDNIIVIGLVALTIFLYSLSGDLENENRDFEVDKLANLKNTVQTINNLKASKLVHKVILFINYSLITLIVFMLLTENFTSTNKILDLFVPNLLMFLKSLGIVLIATAFYKFVILRKSFSAFKSENSFLEIFHTTLMLSVSLVFALSL